MTGSYYLLLVRDISVASILIIDTHICFDVIWKEHCSILFTYGTSFIYYWRFYVWCSRPLCYHHHLKMLIRFVIFLFPSSFECCSVLLEFYIRCPVICSGGGRMYGEHSFFNFFIISLIFTFKSLIQFIISWFSYYWITGGLLTT